MSTTSRKAAKSALIIIVFTLGSKILGFLREVLIAAKFGSGMETDAFFVALTATSIITGLMANTIKTTFVPVLSDIEAKEGAKGKIRHTNNMINIIIVFSLVLASAGFLAAPILVKILAKGFQGEQFKLATTLTRIGMPKLIISCVLGVFAGFLHSEQRHASVAAIGIPFNLVYIFFLIFLSGIYGIRGLMVAAVVAVLSQLLIQISEIKKSKYRYEPVFDIKDKYIRKALYLSLPVFVGVAINDLNAIVDRTLASSLTTGSISALNYANKLNQLILGVFIYSITTVVFPILSKEASNKNIPALKKTMGYGVNLILLITLPTTVGMIILAKPIVEIAFQRGAFDAAATAMTSQALMFYSIGLVAMALNQLISSVYYSLQDTKTPMINSGISLAMNVVLNLIFIRFLAHAGLALATSIATTITAFFLLYQLKKKIGRLGTMVFLRCGLKAGLASAVMGVAVYATYSVLYSLLGESKINNIVSFVTSSSLAVIVYIVLCYLLKVNEIRMFVDKIIIRIKRLIKKK